MSRFHQTFFISNPDEVLKSLFKRIPSTQKELNDKRLKVHNLHYQLQDKQRELNMVSKIIFDTTNRFLDSFEHEFKTLATTLKVNKNIDGELLKTKTGESLKQIILFSGSKSNSYMTCNPEKRSKSEETLKQLIANLKNDKNENYSHQYSDFIDVNFTQLFKYNLSNLSHVARAFLPKEDFQRFDNLLSKVNNCELINKQFISKCDHISHDMLTLTTKFCNDEISLNKKTQNQPSKVTHILVAKGRNIPPGTILKINKDNYKHYWRGLAKAKKVDVIFDDDKKGDIAKDNIVFLEQY